MRERGDVSARALLDEFAERGIVRLTGVFSEDEARAMRNAVSEGVRVKRHPAFRRIVGEPLRQFATALLGEGWKVSKGLGNVLVSDQDCERWFLPGQEALWHSDFPYTFPMDPLPALRVFAVFGSVPPGGGGTLLVAGSHRMVARFAKEFPEAAAKPAKRARAACHGSNDWLHDLTGASGTDPGRTERFIERTTDVDGIPAQVIEACGDPGDVFVCHPWTIHCRPPNAAPQSRFLRSPTLSRRPAS